MKKWQDDECVIALSKAEALYPTTRRPATDVEPHVAGPPTHRPRASPLRPEPTWTDQLTGLGKTLGVVKSVRGCSFEIAVTTRATDFGLDTWIEHLDWDKGA